MSFKKIESTYNKCSKVVNTNTSFESLQDICKLSTKINKRDISKG